MLTQLRLFQLPRDSVSASRTCFKSFQHYGLLANVFSSQPKSQPKSAAVTKTNGASGTRGKAGRRAGARGARNPRPAKKTAEELDSEMADYFQSGTTATENGGAAQPAANGDANMDDEILVSGNNCCS